ncbi:Catabolite control protein A [compost metagenome]
MKKLSLKDIARLAGASPSTVSFVLNGKAKEMRISEELTAKIIAVSQEAGYQPNQIAVSLRTGRSKMIGVLVETITGAFFSTLAKLIEDEMNGTGYKVVHSSTDNDGKKGCDIINMLSQRQVDGYLITPALGMENSIQDLINRKKPVVFMDSNLPGFDVPYVSVDNYSGVKEGIELLISKGHKNIGFVTVDIELDQMEQRTQSYKDTLQNNKLSGDAKLLLKLPYGFERDEAVDKITSWIKRTPELDAIFFATNYLGIMGLESLMTLKKKIPEDIAVICFDDHDLFRLYPPGITCIQQPMKDIAKTATKLLMDQINQTSTSTASKSPVVQLPVKLVKRGSV